MNDALATTAAFLECPRARPRGGKLFQLAIIETKERLVRLPQGSFAGLSDTDFAVLHVIDS